MHQSLVSKPKSLHNGHHFGKFELGFTLQAEALENQKADDIEERDDKDDQGHCLG